MFQRFGGHCAALFYVSLFSWTSLGTVSLDLMTTDPVAVEAGRSAQIHLGRKGDTSRPATVSYSINSISSTGVLVTDDLVQASGQLIFEPGQTNAVLMIEAKHDGLAEDVYEYFDFVLTQIDGDDLGDPKRIKLQVIDAETAVRRHPSFQPLYSVNGFGGLLKLADGSLLVAGDFGCDDRGCFTLRKLKPNGELDRNVRFDRALNVDRLDAIYETADAIVLGGRIILDRIEQNLVRISKTGQVDRSFSIPEGNNRFAGFQPDGRAIMIESGTNLIRCDLDGRVDKGFEFPFHANVVNFAFVEADGSIFVNFSDQPVWSPVLKHLFADGREDTSFPATSCSVVDMLTIGDAVYVAGICPWQWDIRREGVIKLSRSGVELGFREVPVPGLKLSVASEGKIWAGLWRLNGDLTVDSSFIGIGGPTSAVVVDNMDGTVFASSRISSYYIALERVYATNRDLTEIEFGSPSFSCLEGGSCTVTLRRIGRTAESNSVTIEAIPLTANPEEISPASAEVVFAPLQTEASITFRASGNLFPQRDRSSTLVITGHPGTILGVNSNAAFRVVDDDRRPGGFAVLPESGWSLVPPSEFISVSALKRHPSGLVIAAGKFSRSQNRWEGPQVMLFDQSGLPKTSFVTRPMFFGATDVAVQSSGRILVSGEAILLGSSELSINAMDIQGVYDGSFSVKGVPGTSIDQMGLQGDGKILICGRVSSYEGNRHLNLQRLRTDGTYDADFVGASELNFVRLIGVQPDDKILISCSSSLGRDVRVLRLNGDGSLDSSFNAIRNPGVETAIALQGDGRILVSFLEPDVEMESTNSTVMRFDGNGIADDSFRGVFGFEGSVAAMSLLPDGRIAIGGRFQMSATTKNLAVLKADGSLDTGFDAGTAGAVTALLLLDNGDLLVGGRFTEFNGIPCSGLVALRLDGKSELRNAEIRSNRFAATVVGSPGEIWRVERSSDLRQWSTVTNITLLDYSAEVEESVSGMTAFYRLAENNGTDK